MKRFQNHKTVKFDPVLICSEHSHKMVENFCYDCNAMACMDCMFDKHADHNTEYLDVAAQKARYQLSDFIIKLDARVPENKIILNLKHAALRIEENKEKLRCKIENSKLAWNKFEARMDKAVETMYSDIRKELQCTSENQTKINEMSSAQRKMLKTAECLVEELSDAQVVTGPQDFPEPDIGITEIEVNIPLLGEHFNKLASYIDAMSVDISYTKEVYKILRRQKYIKSYLHHVKDIDIGCSLLGLYRCTK